MIIGFARQILKIPPFGTMKSENLKDLEAFTFPTQNQQSLSPPGN